MSEDGKVERFEDVSECVYRSMMDGVVKDDDRREDYLWKHRVSTFIGLVANKIVDAGIMTTTEVEAFLAESRR